MGGRVAVGRGPGGYHGPMLPYVRFTLPDGDSTTLVPGELIGRAAGAALCLDDARISEAHAMVSLRGGELKLLALRGRFTLRGPPLTELVLEPGQRIVLARGLHLEVAEVSLPEAVFALEGPNLPRQVLAGVCSLVLAPRPRLVPRYAGDAAAWFWTTGQSWRVRRASGGSGDLIPGPLAIGGETFTVVLASLEAATPLRTQGAGGVAPALDILASYDTVQLHRQGEAPLVLTGRQARILSELAAIGAPCAWESVAPPLWPELSDREALRRRWDVTLAKLRSKLRAGGVRGDLIHADGKGNFELVLYPGDRVRDNT